MQQPTRRDIVVGAAAGLVTPASATTSAAPAPQSTSETKDLGADSRGQTANGTVTEIVLDGGPVLAKGPPVAGVLVSNGRDVTRTDANGRFSLPVAPGQVVFMIKPAGYRVPVETATKLPLFAYVHDPNGTPAELGFRYRGLPPTGALPPSIDFQLTRVPEPQKFDVILFTDPQPESTTEIEFIRDDLVAGLVGTDAAFGITCGDIAFDDLSMYGRINRIIGRIGLPWWNIGGNHDLDYEAPDAARSRDTFKRVFGAPYYAHEHGNALFVMLDNVDYLGAASAKPGEPHGSYRGFISADQLTFVKNLLAATPAERLLVFVMHIPLSTYLDPKSPGVNTVNAADLLTLVGDRPAVSFSGHTHTTEHHYLGAAAGASDAKPHHHHVLTAVCGSWWSGPLDHRGIACADSYDGTPNGHHVLSIDGASYTTRYVPAAEPADKQMRISLDTQYHTGDREIFRDTTEANLLRSPISVDQTAGTRVVVNLFDGGPRSKVAMALDDGALVPMTHVSRPDPFVVQLYGRYPATIKPWVKPQPSHVWQAALPAGLKPGAYALKIVATDEYGRTHRDGMVLEVV